MYVGRMNDIPALPCLNVFYARASKGLEKKSNQFFFYFPFLWRGDLVRREKEREREREGERKREREREKEREREREGGGGKGNDIISQLAKKRGDKLTH